MCEIVISGLTYDCGPYVIVICDSSGNNCFEVVITPDPISGGTIHILTSLPKHMMTHQTLTHLAVSHKRMKL